MDDRYQLPQTGYSQVYVKKIPVISVDNVSVEMPG